MAFDIESTRGFQGFSAQNIRVVSDVEGFFGFSGQKNINFIFTLRNSAGIFLSDAKITLQYETTQEIINPSEPIVYERLLPTNTSITIQIEKTGFAYRELRFLILPGTVYPLNIELERENCIASTPWNELNFLRWHESNFNLNTIERCPDVCPEEGENVSFSDLNSEYFYALPVLKNDVIEFQINTVLDLNIPVDSVKIGMVNCCKLVFNNVGNLFAPIGDTGKYTGIITVPVLPDGVYNFIIYNANNYRAIALSNPVEVVNFQNRPTTIIKYRNFTNIINFDYLTNTAFYNQYRLDLNLFNTQTVEETSSYEDLNYNQVTPKAVIKKERELETERFDSFAHDALHFALRHNEVYMNGKRYKMVAGYERQEQKGFALSNATTRLQEVSFTKNITSCNT